jgi:hypothetical protein
LHARARGTDGAKIGRTSAHYDDFIFMQTSACVDHWLEMNGSHLLGSRRSRRQRQRIGPRPHRLIQALAIDAKQRQQSITPGGCHLYGSGFALSLQPA